MSAYTPVIPVPGRQVQVDFWIWPVNLASHRVPSKSGGGGEPCLRRKKKDEGQLSKTLTVET